MDDPPSTEARPAEDEQLAELEQLRALVTTTTQRLLGETISLSDEEWRAPSWLPRWSRGHVGTHVARQADALVRLTGWARTGERQDMYASMQQREDDIDAGAGRSGLELQIDLDTSAERLTEAFEALDETEAWGAVVELRGGLAVPARLLPLARITEVVLHHVDLGCGFDVDDIDQTTAEWLLEWSSFRLRNRDDFPRLDLLSDSGFRVSLGNAGDPLTVVGTSARLLGWLSGRSEPSAVEGSKDLKLPPF